MTKSSSKRAQRRTLVDLDKFVPEANFVGILNQFTDLAAMVYEAWVRERGPVVASNDLSHLISALAARHLIQFNDPLAAAESFRKMTLTHMLGVVPDVEKARGIKMTDVADKLLLAGAVVTEVKQ